MPRPSANTSLYRPAAGIVIFNAKGRVWLGRRKGEKSKHVWQFPQGGIDKGEKPKAAALRELWEETGLKPKHVAYLGKIKGWLYYDFPAEYHGRKSIKGWRGQKQKWFAYRLIGDERHIDLTAHHSIEFTKWRWGHLYETPDLIIPFKRKVYERVVDEFTHFAHPHTLVSDDG